MERAKMFFKRWAVPLLCGLFVVLLFRFILILGYVPSSSMEPTIEQGSYIIGVRIYGELQRGDIVIFNHGNRQLVKRVAAIPGDVVYVSGATVCVNKFLVGAEKTIEVPEGHFYMLGDYEDDSFDSRYWEEPLICEKEILAKLLSHL